MTEDHNEKRSSAIDRLHAAMGQRIREEREKKGWTQQQLAEKAGTTQQTINRIERNVTVHSRAIPAAAKALGMQHEELPENLTKQQLREIAERVSERLIFHPTHESEGDIKAGKIPVFSSILLDGVVCRGDLPFRWMPTPEPLIGVQDGFAVVVYEEAMVPVYGPGDTILVNPMLKPREHNDALFITTARATRQIHIGQVVSVDSGTWTARQLDKADPQTFDRSEWTAYTIVGRFIRT